MGVGEKINMLTVSSYAGAHGGRNLWLCLCSCGNSKTFSTSKLNSGEAISCGCHWPKHKMSKSKLYKVWNGMKERCTNKKHVAFKNYGGRGISVCKEWYNSFEVFYSDMAPSYFNGASIDRIENNSGYSKGNCKWSDRIEQNRNKRNNLFFTIDGVSMCLSDWAKKYNKNPETVIYRVRTGKTIQEALTQTNYVNYKPKHNVPTPIIPRP